MYGLFFFSTLRSGKYIFSRAKSNNCQNNHNHLKIQNKHSVVRWTSPFGIRVQHSKFKIKWKGSKGGRGVYRWRAADNKQGQTNIKVITGVWVTERNIDIRNRRHHLASYSNVSWNIHKNFQTYLPELQFENSNYSSIEKKIVVGHSE